MATNTISRFLVSESHNLKHIGITGLAQAVKLNSKYAVTHQETVVDCLEDADDTLKIKTFDLLYRMTNRQNVEPIVERMIGYLKNAPSESNVRKELVFKIHDLTEQFSPNKTWFVRTTNKLFELGGELVTAEMSDKFIKSISEWESEIDGEKFRESTIKIYMNVLKKNPNISDSMMKVIAWILGEYGW